MPFVIRCPRCKESLKDDDPEALADDVLAHLRDVHDHEPPRDHVLARIAEQNQRGGEV